MHRRLGRTARTSRKFSSDCGVIEGPPISLAASTKTFAAAPRSMTALDVAQKVNDSHVWYFGAWWWQSPDFIGRKIRAIHRYNVGCRNGRGAAIRPARHIPLARLSGQSRPQPSVDFVAAPRPHAGRSLGVRYPREIT